METTVRFRDCECPGTPHAEEGDTVALRPHLGWMAGAEAARILVATLRTDPEHLNEELGPIYLRKGPVDWNLLDEDGEPVPFDAEVLMALPFDQAFIIADRADDLYTEAVLRPLAKRMRESSADTPTSTTSRIRPSSSNHLTPVGPSSRATSAAGKRRAG